MDDNFDTQSAVDYFRTQPEYTLYPLVWGKVLESLRMPRAWNAVFRTQGSDGDTMHIRIVNSYRGHFKYYRTMTMRLVSLSDTGPGYSFKAGNSTN